MKKTGISLKLSLTTMIVICWLVPIIIVIALAGVMFENNNRARLQQELDSSARYALHQVHLQLSDAINESKTLSYDGIVGTHDLVIHNYGPSKYMASIHAEVPANIDIMFAHETIDRIERDIQEEMGIFLVIHMDPIEVDNAVVDSSREAVIDVIAELNCGVTMHDFRMVSGEKVCNLLFDIVVPPDTSDERAKEIKHTISEEAKKKDKRYNCIIEVDIDYAG